MFFLFFFPNVFMCLHRDTGGTPVGQQETKSEHTPTPENISRGQLRKHDTTDSGRSLRLQSDRTRHMPEEQHSSTE